MKYNKYTFELLFIIIIIGMYYKYIPDWVQGWADFDSFYAFGFFMIAFQGYFFWTNHEKLKNLPRKSSLLGIPFLLAGTILYVLGIRADYILMTNVSLPFFLTGSILSLYGIKTFKFVLIPLVLFTFSIPILPLYRITLPLQLFSANAAAGLLKFVGINAHNEGNILFVEKYRLAVVAGCSGLKSLSTLFFICLIYTYFMKISIIKKALFILSSIPIAISMNVLRLFFVGFYALYNGYNGLMEFHDNVGIVGYFISIILIFAVVNFIQPNQEEKIHEN